MKKLLIFAIIGLAFGCKKSGSSNTTPAPALTGTYSLYFISDTTYLANSTTDIAYILNEGMSGDTSYSLPGTPYYSVQLNTIPNYTPSYNLDDVINFTSTSGGTETLYGNDTFAIAYSLNNNGFGGGYNYFQYKAKLYIINSNTIKIYIYEIDGQRNGKVSFYKKQ